MTLTYFFFSEFIGKVKQTCPPKVTQTTGQLGIYCYGSSNLRHLLRGINFRRICNTNKSELVSVKIKSSGSINLRESSLSNLIREIKTDIQAFGQTSIEKRLYIIIHIGYNLFCDQEIGVDYIKYYNNFLKRLAAIFPPGNIIVYLPFIRGICQRQVIVQISVVKRLQDIASRLGYIPRNLFEILPLSYPLSQEQIIKFYNPETGRKGSLKAIHFSESVRRVVCREIEVILSKLITTTPK